MKRFASFFILVLTAGCAFAQLPPVGPASPVTVGSNGKLNSNYTGGAGFIAQAGQIFNFSLASVILPNTVTTPANTITVANVATLRTTMASVNGQYIQTAGYYSANDGGQGLYVWNSTSTATDNGGTVIQVTGVTTGRWLLQYSGPINILQFGAKSDTTTDNEPFFAAALAAQAGQTTIYVPTKPGYYRIASTIVMGGQQFIRGDVKDSAAIFIDGNFSGIKVNATTATQEQCGVSNLQLIGTVADGSSQVGIELAVGSGLTIQFCTIDHVTFSGCYTQIKTTGLGAVDWSYIEDCESVAGAYGVSHYGYWFTSSWGLGIIANDQIVCSVACIESIISGAQTFGDTEITGINVDGGGIIITGDGVHYYNNVGIVNCHIDDVAVPFALTDVGNVRLFGNNYAGGALGTESGCTNFLTDGGPYQPVSTWGVDVPFTPTLNGFTIVNGTGGIAATGIYTINGPLVKATITIIGTGTATIASVAGTSYVSGLPFTAAHSESGSYIFNGTVVGGPVAVTGTYAFPGAWSAATAATAGPIVITCVYSQ